MEFHEVIPSHGGQLINRMIDETEKNEWTGFAKTVPVLRLSRREVSDLEMIATGGFSPLEGFMGKRDYESVVARKRLADGTVWTIPITLAVDKQEADALEERRPVALTDRSGSILALLHLEERYGYDKEREAEQVYGTQDPSHPGVEGVYWSGDVLLGGKITMLERPAHEDFTEYRLEPKDTREAFAAQGWERVVGFQTRNPLHRGHEYLIKCAMELVDGLLLHPLVGETKRGNVPAEVRIRCYEELIHRYFPKDRVLMGVLDTAMRYAGPREAVFHAIVRKNFGCTHFIVGRDHAGVGSFYGPFDAHRIFEEFPLEEIGIAPLFFDHAFFCKLCGGIASCRTCPHSKDNRLFLTGTRVRELIAAGESPPPEFMRPEVAEVLMRDHSVG